MPCSTKMPTATRHSIEVSEHAGVRSLHFGSDWVQGAMRVARPWALELDYTREMMAPLLMRPVDWPRRVLIVGLGAGSLLKFLYRHRPQAQLTVVEINPAVVPVAYASFRVPDDPQRIDLRLADGAVHVRDCAADAAPRYDLILVDGYDAKARAGALDTVAFYRDARACLAPEGLLCANLFGRARGYAQSVARLREAFLDRVLAFPSCDSGNAVALGAGEGGAVYSEAELREASTQLRADTGLDLRGTVTRLAAAGAFASGRLAL